MSSASSSPSNPGALLAPFVGRRQELAELRSTLDQIRERRGQVVLMAGEPGIGKTRTAIELESVADSLGYRVLWGRCFAWEGAPAYWPWIQLLRAYRDIAGDDRLRSDLGDSAASVAQIVPEIRQLLPDILPLPAMEPEQARFHLFESYVAVFTRAARDGPLVLILDDLHWADRPSLLLLQFLAQAIEHSEILVVGTFRDVEVNRQHPLAGTLAELSRLPHTLRITLRGLPRSDVSALVDRLIDRETPPTLVDAIFEGTEGNPFFTTEVVRLLASEGRFDPPIRLPLGPVAVPESVREAIDRRLDRLSPECNRLLSIGSVIGRDFSLTLMDRVTREPVDALLNALEEAIAARLIETLDSPAQFRFSHALVQETVYLGIGVSQRLRLHARVGETLEQMHATDLEPSYSDLAHHYFQAASLGVAEKAIAFTLKAARWAELQLAWESAISQYERTLQVLDLLEPHDERLRCEVLLSLGEAQSRAGTGAGRVIGAGNSPAAVETYMEAARVARAARMPEHFARAAFGIVGISLSVAQGFNEASELMREALAELPYEDAVLRAHLLAGYAAHRSALMAIGKLRLVPSAVIETEQHADEAVAMARRLGDPATLSYALHARCSVSFGHHKVDQLRADAEEAVETAIAVGDSRLHVLATFDVYQAALFRADFDSARRAVDDLQRIAAPLKTRYFDYVVGVCHMGQAMRDGRFADAELFNANALASWPGGGIATWQLLALRREQARVSEVADAVRSIYEQLPAAAMAVVMWILALLESQRIDEARLLFESALLDKPVPFAKYSAVRVLSICAEISDALGDRERARKVYTRLLPHARDNVFATNSDHVSGSASSYLGILAMTLERWDDAERHFADGLAMNERWGIRPAKAWTRYHWTDMLARRADPHDRVRARSLLDTANAEADQLGMPRLAGKVSALLDRLGQHDPSRSGHAPVFRLSQRELEVLRQIGAGHSDKEIAQLLSISPRTVTTHVTNILNKLGANSRTEAAMIAVRVGILSSTYPRLRKYVLRYSALNT